MYPRLMISLKGIENNARILNDLCTGQGIFLTGVVKSSDCREHSYLPILSAMKAAGIRSFGDSRIPTLRSMREGGNQDTLMLLRIPMLSEVEDLVRYATVSLESEEVLLRAISKEAVKQKRVHRVILMIDLGDLREGIYDEKEILDMALLAEDLPGLHLLGIGTNLGCYGCVVPSEENLSKLVFHAERIENAIGRTLEIISGGATSTLPLILEGKIPKRINHLRIGEGILLGRDLDELWHVDIPGMQLHNYVVQAEVIEIKVKPSHPLGEIFIDAFGKKKTFEDKGMHKRALVALGARDVGDFSTLTPLTEGAVLLGGSSDHAILDITDVKEEIEIGSLLSFNLFYKGMVHAIESSGMEILHC